MIDINNRQEITDIIKKLSVDSSPLWGKMTAQHMVEHLTFTVKFSNGKTPQRLYFTQEKAELIKTFVVYSDKDLTKGFKAPMLGDDLPGLENPDIQTAVENLFVELERFDNYFVLNPDAKPTNPTMGELDRQEWIKFHNKHFTHHFRQFNLI
jgi:hypothetical protein